MAGLSASRKRLIALVLGLALGIALILVAATSGLGQPSVPADAVAVVDDVDDGTVSQADYDRAMEQAAAGLGLEEPPAPGSEQFAEVNDQTMQGLLLAIWAEGEAADRGIEVTETDVEDELAQIEESFQSKKEFRQVVRQSKFCTEEEIEADTPPIECEDVIAQGRLLALQRKLSEAFATEPEVSDEDVEDFYESNQEAFQQPATRSVRVILNEDEQKVDRARQQLEGLSPDDPDFEKTWRQVAKQLSQDQASKDRGGLLEGLSEGQGDPALEEEVFGAPTGELVGPFETERGFYLIQVVDSTEASTQPLEEAAPQIRQQVAAARQQAEQTETQNDFIAKWTARTICEPEVRMQLCAGFVPPVAEPIPGQPEAPQPPPVQSNAPIEPGTASISIDGTTQTGLPQGPQIPPPEGADAGALPPGSVPVGPDGAPLPPGAGGAPPGGAPPGGAPPGGAPPGGPPPAGTP